MHTLAKLIAIIQVCDLNDKLKDYLPLSNGQIIAMLSLSDNQYCPMQHRARFAAQYQSNVN